MEAGFSLVKEAEGGISALGGAERAKKLDQMAFKVLSNLKDVGLAISLQKLIIQMYS